MTVESKSAAPSGRLPPWEAYHRALCDGRAARGRYFRSTLSAALRIVKERICQQAQQWHIRLCPLCC